MTVTTDVDVISTWQTPLYLHDLAVDCGELDVARINGELRRIVLEGEEREANPLTLGVIGGTKTSLNILQWDDPAIGWLKEHILEAVDALAHSVGADTETQAQVDLIAEGWAVVYRSGASHRLHTHHESAWSGVYYIDVGGVDQDAGHLQLVDPRPGAIARQASTGVHYIEPRPGVMVVFPSWLPHSVKATLFEGGTRICVAFNVGYRERITP